MEELEDQPVKHSVKEVTAVNQGGPIFLLSGADAKTTRSLILIPTYLHLRDRPDRGQKSMFKNMFEKVLK